VGQTIVFCRLSCCCGLARARQTTKTMVCPTLDCRNLVQPKFHDIRKLGELNRYAVRRQRRHSCLPARCAIAGGGLMTRPVGVGQVGNLRTDCQSVPAGASPAGCRHVETPPNLSLATPPIREAWPSFCAIIMPMRAAQPTKRRMVRLAPKHFQGDLINTQKAIAPPNPISPLPVPPTPGSPRRRLGTRDPRDIPSLSPLHRGLVH